MVRRKCRRVENTPRFLDGVVVVLGEVLSAVTVAAVVAVADSFLVECVHFWKKAGWRCIRMFGDGLVKATNPEVPWRMRMGLHRAVNR